MMDSDDESPQLSGDTLAVLKEFYAERDSAKKRLENFKGASSHGPPGTFSSTTTATTQHRGVDPREKLSMDLFAEDWNASQFWYTDNTASTLARQLLADLGSVSAIAIAVISAPSTYVQLHNMLAELRQQQQQEGQELSLPRMVKLLEFDERFAVLGDEFVRYDFNKPTSLPVELKGQFDRVIVDPPFLSEDCQTKAALTARWLMRPSALSATAATGAGAGDGSGDDSGQGASPNSARVIICTGERMSTLIHKIYPGCRATDFVMEHSKGRLSNEFLCYANFECEDWKWVNTRSAGD